MRPSAVRPRGILIAAWSGWRAAMSGRWRAMLADSGQFRLERPAQRVLVRQEGILRLTSKQSSACQLACQGAALDRCWRDSRAICTSWERVAMSVGQDSGSRARRSRTALMRSCRASSSGVIGLNSRRRSRRGSVCGIRLEALPNGIGRGWGRAGRAGGRDGLAAHPRCGRPSSAARTMRMSIRCR